MRKRAAREPGGGDRPSLTPTPPPLAPGAIVVIDVDRMGEYVEERGLSEYRPNDITGTLSALVEDLVRRRGGYLVYGLDWERGTEEAVIEFPLTEPEELAGDLARIAEEICGLGWRVSIVAVKGATGAPRGRGRRGAYEGWRAAAKRLLEAAKRRGGGVVVVDGVTVYSCRGAATRA